MTPDQRLDRVERILILFAKAGRRERQKSREQDEKINILIQTQMETSDMINRTSEMINSLATDHEKEIAEVRREQKLTQQALRAFINSLRKGRNGKSSN
jgi:tRNA uridine 5-carbamoylmethylation protein Kti12